MAISTGWGEWNLPAAAQLSSTGWMNGENSSLYLSSPAFRSYHFLPFPAGRGEGELVGPPRVQRANEIHFIITSWFSAWAICPHPDRWQLLLHSCSSTGRAGGWTAGWWDAPLAHQPHKTQEGNPDCQPKRAQSVSHSHRMAGGLSETNLKHTFSLRHRPYQPTMGTHQTTKGSYSTPTSATCEWDLLLSINWECIYIYMCMYICTFWVCILVYLNKA